MSTEPETARAGRHLTRLHALSDTDEKEAGAAARAAHEARAALLGMTTDELKARYRKILAGPPATREAQARVAALFGLVLLPEPEDSGT
jgi:hypothetical protein